MAGKRVKEFQAFDRQAAKALTKLQAAVRLIDLRHPPSNRFEALGGDRNGQYSIRINGQWRVCFRWSFTDDVPADVDLLTIQGEPYDVEITDYH
nr:type II toxin-antitoxin system RelE/ParE family toxin [Azospirillum argentinense]